MKKNKETATIRENRMVQPLPEAINIKMAYELVRPDPGQPRKTFSEQSLNELADSIREHGILQDLVLERMPAKYRLNEPDLTTDNWQVMMRAGDEWELRCADTEVECRKFIEELEPDALEETYRIVCGERRWRAAGIVGLTMLPARAYVGLSQEQRFAMQFIENNQRENISALEEAAALAKQLEERQRLDVTFSAEMLARELGMSRAGIYERLKLNRLQPKIREALVAGTISTSIAAEIAKLPTPAQQEKLLKRIEEASKYHPMSVRDVQEEIADEYVKSLADAPFGQDETYRTDGTDVLEPCTTCPMRTGNMLAEFPELKSKPNVCTNPECFGEKCKAFWKRKAEDEAQKGKTVLTEKEFKAQKGKLVAADAYEQATNRGGTFEALMGKHAPEPVLVATAEGLEKFYPKEEAVAAARKNGVKFFKDQTPEGHAKEKAKREEVDARRTSRAALAERLAVNLGQKLNKLKPGVVIELMAGLAEQPPAPWRVQAAAWKEAKTPVAKAVVEFLGDRLDNTTCWQDGEWEEGTLKLWKAMGVDLVAEEKAAAAVPELPVKSEPQQLEINGTKATKGTHARKAMVAKIKAAQKARWNKIKADKAKG